MSIVVFIIASVSAAGARPNPAEIVQITAGEGHTCVLRGDGKVLCWGNPGERYQEGDEPPSTAELMEWSQPQVVSSAPRGVVAIDAGGYHTCALTLAGEVWCWGEGRDGQLGKASSTPRRTARRVMKGARSVSAGGAHSCAVQEGGSLWCWGSNSHGQLGIGSEGDTSPQVRRVDLAEVDHVSAGAQHTCARVSNGHVYCWGANSLGQVGSKSKALLPKRVPAMTVQSVSAGRTLTCAVSKGKETCFGERWIGNPHGRMNEVISPPGAPGRSTLGDSGAKVVAVQTDGEVACSLDDKQQIECWTYGRMHTRWPAQWAFQRPTPKVRVFAVGGRHACAVTEDNRVACWGKNGFGQLGNGRIYDGTKPQRVSGIETATQVVAGRRHSCALLRDGSVRCWGWNSQGTLGVQGPERQPAPQQVTGVEKAVSLDTSEHTTCALRSDGKVQCWGSNQIGNLADGTRAVQTGAVYTKIPDASDVGVGSGATCITVRGRNVRCWGNSGVLGGGKGGVLARIKGTEQVLPGNFDWGCLRTKPGAVHCWNEKQGYKPPTKKLVEMRDLPPATDLDVYGCTACAVLKDGTVRCRGNGQSCTAEKSGTFTARFGELGAVEVAVGDRHQCARTGGGHVWCRGLNAHGQLGTGDYESSDLPRKVAGLENVVSIGAGESHSCAVTNDGSVWCWGTNGHGELGQKQLGSTPSTYREPVVVRGL